MVRIDKSVEPFLHLDDYGLSEMPYALDEAHSIRDVTFNPVSSVWRREGCYLPVLQIAKGRMSDLPKVTSQQSKD